MSTTARLVRNAENGEVEVMYIGASGYKEWTGEKLLADYNTPEAVDALFSIGQEVRELRETFEETAQNLYAAHSRPLKNWRGKFLADAPKADYTYVWLGNSWLI